jgi:hypothetical protein
MKPCAACKRHEVTAGEKVLTKIEPTMRKLWEDHGLELMIEQALKPDDFCLGALLDFFNHLLGSDYKIRL